MDFDEAFYEGVLRTHLADPSIEVISINRELPTEVGDNYLSDIFRVRVVFSRISSPGDGDVGCRTNETRSFILKNEPFGNPSVLEMVQAQEMFTVELRVLRDILPRIESALGIRLGPKFVYGRDEPPRVIMMEDLAQEGFNVKNRQEGLSMAHAKIAIENLARFHAASVALEEENPESLKIFKQAFFNEKTPPNIYVVVTNALTRVCEIATTWSDEGSASAADKLRNIVASVKDRIEKVYEHDGNEFCVLNHGDTWINNLLFTEDRHGKPLEQRYVDYQMANFSSPAVDLLFFLSLNPAFEDRGPGEELLLKIYAETLSAAMKELRCKTEPPTIARLKEAMYRRRALAVISSLVGLPRLMFSKDVTKAGGLDKLLKGTETRPNTYQKPNVIRTLRRILPLMNERGYLDP